MPPMEHRQKGSRDELGQLVTQQSIANERATIEMFGAGYIEMLAREMTTDLQAIRDSIAPGQSAQLVSKGVQVRSSCPFARWPVGYEQRARASSVEPGVSRSNRSARSLHSPVSPGWPRLSHSVNSATTRSIITTVFNTTERFGHGTDPDGDGFVEDEMTRADVTAVSVFQADASRARTRHPTRSYHPWSHPPG